MPRGLAANELTIMRLLDDIDLKEIDREAIKQAVRVLRDRFPVERVVLFGSKASGTDDAESDIDLLVLTLRQLEWNERGAMIDALFDVEMAGGVVISPLIVPASEWESGRFAVLPIHEVIEESAMQV